jgi:hypothetical protein
LSVTQARAAVAPLQWHAGQTASFMLAAVPRAWRMGWKGVPHGGYRVSAGWPQTFDWN